MSTAITDEAFLATLRAARCSTDQMVYYMAWHRRAPAKTFLEMLKDLDKIQEEREEAEWKNQQAEDAYYAEIAAKEAEAEEKAEEKAEEEDAWYTEKKKEWAAFAEELEREAANVKAVPPLEKDPYEEWAAAIQQHKKGI